MSTFALGLDVDGDGYHPAAWRRASHSPAELLTPRRVRTVVAAAENAGFTFALFDDSPVAGAPGPDTQGRIDAVTRAAFVAGSTSAIGLVPVASTTYSEPFHVATQIASLDHASRGRAGWLAARTTDRAAGPAFGVPARTDEQIDADQRDAVTVARALWDSWDDDAVIRDSTTGRYLDRDRIRHVGFVGENLSVTGPSIVPRPPQGQVVVFGRDGELPADAADVVVVSGDSVDRLRAAARNARLAGSGRVVAEVFVALDLDRPGHPTETASQRIDSLDAHTGFVLDPGAFSATGDAATVVGILTELASFLDGAILRPLVLDEEIRVLTRLVLPALLGRRVLRRPLVGATLRDHLGLARPVNLIGAS
ncbi:LLM class flavin-dependent oxidoreductase [Dietzia sp. UBA5065]|uniref:LLM class flavin-dependent oxidoreductase n=1 Tax=Dietzia sp. UBA5065 TaxID=1946422 RepID=UPI0025C72374|nr:LLM class flavin-dependent oxidoreductase [Dietzia sp. UBA5065]HMT49614.1 LLM class flavin-dependent oxidoreductase [Dietzia sp.]